MCWSPCSTNPDRPNAGIPRNMTSIAAKMKQAGYATHIVGKWDVGTSCDAAGAPTGWPAHAGCAHRHGDADAHANGTRLRLVPHLLCVVGSVSGGWEPRLTPRRRRRRRVPTRPPVEHKNDYWTELAMQSGCPDSLHIKDLWDTGRPASHLNGTKYEEYMFQDRLNGGWLQCHWWGTVPPS